MTPPAAVTQPLALLLTVERLMRTVVLPLDERPVPLLTAAERLSVSVQEEEATVDVAANPLALPEATLSVIAPLSCRRRQAASGCRSRRCCAGRRGRASR